MHGQNGIIHPHRIDADLLHGIREIHGRNGRGSKRIIPDRFQRIAQREGRNCFADVECPLADVLHMRQRNALLLRRRRNVLQRLAAIKRMALNFCQIRRNIEFLKVFAVHEGVFANELNERTAANALKRLAAVERAAFDSRNRTGKRCFRQLCAASERFTANRFDTGCN